MRKDGRTYCDEFYTDDDDDNSEDDDDDDEIKKDVRAKGDDDIQAACRKKSPSYKWR